MAEQRAAEAAARQSVYRIFGGALREALERVPQEALDKINEIRVRTERPVILSDGRREQFLHMRRGLTHQREAAYAATAKDLSLAVGLVSEHSLYAFEEEIKKGFITISGGHRVGLCGRAVAEQGRIKTLRNITALNVRIARQVRGCADGIMGHLITAGQVRHTMIVSPPGCGKTTLLRDIVRQISDGVPALGFAGVATAVVDERSEIAAAYLGVPQNDIGLRTDVLDCGPKAEGMRLMLRSMSPRVIAVDEIGSSADADAVEELLNAGVRLICTAHGAGIEDLQKNPELQRILALRRLERIVVLSGENGIGTVAAIYDETLRPLPIQAGKGGGIE